MEKTKKIKIGKETFEIGKGQIIGLVVKTEKTFEIVLRGQK
jgi:hypothetical protein